MASPNYVFGNATRYYTVSMPALTGDYAVVCWLILRAGGDVVGGRVYSSEIDPGVGAGLLFQVSGDDTYGAMRGNAGPFNGLQLSTADYIRDGRSLCTVYQRKGTTAELYTIARGNSRTAPNDSGLTDAGDLPAGVWSIGRDHPGNDEFCDLPIAEFAVVNGSLSLAEINWLAKGNPATSIKRRLHVYLPFRNGAPAIEMDRSGNGRHATRNGTDFGLSRNVF